MKKEIRKRIAIIELPGNGKSTFSTKFGNILNIPVHHLDRHMFDGRKKRDRQEFLSIKESLVSEESWIIEGCSLSTLERCTKLPMRITLSMTMLEKIGNFFLRFLSFCDLYNQAFKRFVIK